MFEQGNVPKGRAGRPPRIDEIGLERLTHPPTNGPTDEKLFEERNKNPSPRNL